MKKRIGILFTAAALLLSMLAGCADSAENSSTESSTPSSTTSESSSSSEESSQTEEESAFPVTITDASGREVTIEEEPETLVSGYYITTSMLIALGEEDKLVGVEAKANTRPIYSLAAPELLELPSVGTAKEFDLEGCAALEPDLVILPLKLKDSVSALEDLGIQAITVNPEDLSLLEETITMLGKATGATETAEKLLAFNEETQDKLDSLLKDVEKPTVYLGGNSSFLSTAGAAMYQNTLIELGGGANVAAELTDTYWAEVSYEQILEWNPQVIIIVPEAGYTKEDVLADAQLAEVDAVKNKQVYEMPSAFEAWDSPVPSAMLGSLWMAATLHSDVYSTEDFQKDVADFYQEFYGFTADTAQLAE